MSIELLLQKIGVLILLLSILPGAWLGWREMRGDHIATRITFAFLSGMGLPCLVFGIGMLLYLIGSALLFVIT